MTSRSRGRLVTFVSVTLLCVALIVTTLRWRDSAKTVDTLDRAVAAQREALLKNDQLLAELCRTNGIIRGVLAESIELLKISEARVLAGIPRNQRGRYRLGRPVLQGYLEQLDQQTACREVIRP